MKRLAGSSPTAAAACGKGGVELVAIDTFMTFVGSLTPCARRDEESEGVALALGQFHAIVLSCFPVVLMRRCLIGIVALCLSVPAMAHFPDKGRQRIHGYFDLIPPLGNRLPMSYRRFYNRPSHIGGRIAYFIEPTSQEAMAWHRAAHKGYYKNHAPRMVTHYFYPKPWDAIRIGARPATAVDAGTDAYGPSYLQDSGESINGAVASPSDMLELPAPSNQPAVDGMIEE